MKPYYPDNLSFEAPYFCPYGAFCPRVTMNAFIRVLHASPGAPAVDVYANGKLIAGNLAYRAFTPYQQVDSGNYNILIYPAGQMTTPLLDTSVRIEPGTISTVVAINRPGELGLQLIPEPKLMIPPGRTMVRFIHLSPNAPGVDVTLPNGRKLFSDVTYREVTDYIPVNPGTYTLQARIADTDQVVLNVPNVRLLPSRFYSVYAVGLAAGTPPLQVLIPLDGNTYLLI